MDKKSRGFTNKESRVNAGSLRETIERTETDVLVPVVGVVPVDVRETTVVRVPTVETVLAPLRVMPSAAARFHHRFRRSHRCISMWRRIFCARRLTRRARASITHIVSLKNGEPDVRRPSFISQKNSIAQRSKGQRPKNLFF